MATHLLITYATLLHVSGAGRWGILQINVLTCRCPAIKVTRFNSHLLMMEKDAPLVVKSVMSRGSVNVSAEDFLFVRAVGHGNTRHISAHKRRL